MLSAASACSSCSSAKLMRSTSLTPALAVALRGDPGNSGIDAKVGGAVRTLRGPGFVHGFIGQLSVCSSDASAAQETRRHTSVRSAGNSLPHKEEKRAGATTYLGQVLWEG